MERLAPIGFDPLTEVALADKLDSYFRALEISKYRELDLEYNVEIINNALAVRVNEVLSLLQIEKDKIPILIEKDIFSIRELEQSRYLTKIAEVSDEGNKLLPNCKDQCPRCHEHQTFRKSIQLRSADEASTRCYRCLVCGNEWKRN